MHPACSLLMPKCCVAVFASILLFLPSFAFGQSNIVQNGSFETVFHVPLMVPPWVWEATGGGLVVGGSFAADGANYVFLSGGSIYQDLQTVPGQEYRVRFAMAGNGSGQRIWMDVYWGEVGIAQATWYGPFTTRSDWAWHEVDVTATSESTRLLFVYSGDWMAALDGVQVYPIPEPGSLLLLCLGLGCALVLSRRWPGCSRDQAPS